MSSSTARRSRLGISCSFRAATSRTSSRWRRAEYMALFARVRLLAEPPRRAVGADRIALAVEGYGMPHTHVHLVPVNGLGELDPHRQRLAAAEDLARMAATLRPAFADLRAGTA